MVASCLDCVSSPLPDCRNTYQASHIVQHLQQHACMRTSCIQAFAYLHTRMDNCYSNLGITHGFNTKQDKLFIWVTFSDSIPSFASFNLLEELCG